VAAITYPPAHASTRARGDAPPLSRPARLALRTFGVIGVAGLVLHFLHGQIGLGGHELANFFESWVYDGVILGAAVSCLARAYLVPEDRLAWAVLGAGLLFDAMGEIYWSVAFGDASTVPIPSFADVLYLLYYPCVYAGMVLLARSRITHLSPSTWLDGAIAAAASAAVVAALMFDPIVQAARNGDIAAVATNFAYPVGDVILLGIVIGMFALFGWRPGRTWLVLGIGLLLTAIADVAYLYESAKGTYVVGGFLDSMYVAAGLVMGAAAWQPAPRQQAVELKGRRLLLIPAVFALASLGVLVYGGFTHVSAVGLVLAAAAVLLVFARYAWTYHENVVLLEHSRSDALTDALTGLGNRRAMSGELDRYLRPGCEPAHGVLVMFDLDGFKAYNDRFGHVAGDTLLAHLGRQLCESVRAPGTAYRLGGDEFCVLLPGDLVEAEARIADAVASLTAEGDGFSVTTSYGQVAIPSEAQTATVALRIADDRMYARKGSRRGSASQQTRDVLLEVLRERQPELHDHLCEVGRLAVIVGRRLGMTAEQLDELGRAAELHDVGKAAIPDEILNKPGPLDEHESGFMRRHTLIGERILAAAPALSPVAVIVRSSHERWDGSGYPDGLAGQAIPLGARIVCVCDAFDAMISDRSYAPPMAAAEALAELERQAGTQFDPEVVRIFSAVWRERAERAAGGPPEPTERAAA
jgi:diguanylate cyclase (GGDEF)-like protein